MKWNEIREKWHKKPVDALFSCTMVRSLNESFQNKQINEWAKEWTKQELIEVSQLEMLKFLSVEFGSRWITKKNDWSEMLKLRTNWSKNDFYIYIERRTGCKSDERRKKYHKNLLKYFMHSKIQNEKRQVEKETNEWKKWWKNEENNNLVTRAICYSVAKGK